MADPTVTVGPTDDVGADTLDRFRYQAHLIARACVAMVDDRRISAVICEWHEDYVIQFANGPSEIVSVKHHDGSQSHWTVRQ
ncbi:MAG: dsDNA nuclease domain-containing protein, partial [Acidimicrobiia bacterium]